MRYLSLLAAVPPILFAAASARAQDAAAVDYHEPPSPDIVVTAIARERADIISGVSVLQGAELTQALRPTIGETLVRTPGVSSTSFGPNASRPVLRGLQGERVRVLTDGIGSIDVSNTSVDHAVAIDPLLAERVEVLRGPEALLYGSAALGGVVNVIDRRIPRNVPGEPIHAAALSTYASAADERSLAGAVDVPVGTRFVVHADGSYLKTADLEIGGRVLSREIRDSALPEVATLRGRLPNSAAETWTAGVGAAVITATGNLGVSYSRYDSLYGVPIRFATAAGEEAEAPRIDIKQDRFDARAEVQTGGGVLDRIRARFAYASYRHFELEEDGSVGTAFYNEGMEGRVELVQAQRGAWSGASGVQFVTRDFNVVGEEAFLPRNSTDQIGLFTLQQLELGRLKLQGGARYEHAALQAKPLDQPQFFSGTRRFSTVSASAGASYALGGDWRIGADLSRTVRAPSAEELFADGPHAGTEAFEIGNPDFKAERSWGAQAVLRGKGRGWSVEASAYRNWFANFIYEDRTGDIEDGLPVYQSRQAKARYYGLEVQGTATLARFGDTMLSADALADYVRAEIVAVGPAPRIPPLRLLGGLGLATAKLDGRIEVEWTDAQKRVSAFETETRGFTLVNAQLNFRPWGVERPLSFALSANNLFDVDARRHASFLKDFAPLAGRDLRITARASF